MEGRLASLVDDAVGGFHCDGPVLLAACRPKGGLSRLRGRA
jgi:hypothetical protein